MCHNNRQISGSFSLPTSNAGYGEHYAMTNSYAFYFSTSETQPIETFNGLTVVNLAPVAGGTSPQVMYAWVDYDPATSVIQCYVSTSPEIPVAPVYSGSVHLASFLEIWDSGAYVGFYAAGVGSETSVSVFTWDFEGELEGSPPTEGPGGGGGGFSPTQAFLATAIPLFILVGLCVCCSLKKRILLALERRKSGRRRTVRRGRMVVMEEQRRPNFFQSALEARARAREERRVQRERQQAALRQEVQRQRRSGAPAVGMSPSPPPVAPPLGAPPAYTTVQIDVPPAYEDALRDPLAGQPVGDYVVTV